MNYLSYLYMINNKKEFGKNLRKWRKARGITQEELAFKAETSAPTISSYESGSAVPSFNTMMRLANALEVSPVHLFAYDSKYLTVQDKELQYILVEKFKNIPYEKRKLIFTIIDAIMSENLQ